MTKPLRVILVAEDDADDQMLLTEAFNASAFTGSLQFAFDGVELIGRLSEPELPDLVLLDLNMPRLSGHEVLQNMRNQDRLRSLPVVVLTTSGSSEDVDRAYRSGANTYLQKPRSFKALVNLTQLLQRYWLDLAKLPT